MQSVVTTEAAHAEYSASGCKAWAHCLAQIRMLKDAPPNFDNEWSRDGKIAHAVLADMLGKRSPGATLFALDYVGRTITYDQRGKELLQAVVKPEHARAVQICYDYVAGILEEHPDAQLYVEQKVQVPSDVVPGRMWGTADIIIYSAAARWLWAPDYKHGAGIYVDETVDYQTRFYAVASWFHLGMPQIDGATCAIVQPRSFYAGSKPVREIDMTLEEILTFHHWLDERAALTLDPHAPFVPDAQYCRWCAAAAICPAYEAFALQATGAATLEQLATTQLPSLKGMPYDRLAYIKSAEPFIRGWLKVAGDLLMGAARAGYDTPGFKLVHQDPRRAWWGDHAAIAAQLAALTGLDPDVFFPRTLIGMTEATAIVVSSFREGVVRQEKETKKALTVRLNKASELAHEYLANLTMKEPSANLQLVPLTSPKPRVDAAASYFAGQIFVEPPKE